MHFFDPSRKFSSPVSTNNDRRYISKVLLNYSKTSWDTIKCHKDIQCISKQCILRYIYGCLIPCQIITKSMSQMVNYKLISISSYLINGYNKLYHYKTQYLAKCQTWRTLTLCQIFTWVSDKKQCKTVYLKIFGPKPKQCPIKVSVQ